MAFLVFLQGCRGCWEKEQEQEITITLQTEKPTETTALPPPSRSPSPQATKTPSPPVAEKAKAKGAAQLPSPQPPVSLSPPVQGDDEKIRYIIERQKRAFETKDVDLYLSDLAAGSDKDAAAVGKFFEKYDSIHVDFKVESLSLTGEKAQVIMIQETRLRLQGKDKIQQESRVRVLWGLVKKGDTWKIAEFRRLEEIH